MPINNLYRLSDWRQGMPDAFKGMAKSSTDIYSKYCTIQNKSSELHGSILKALVEYINLHDNKQAKGAVGLQNDCTVVEYADNPTQQPANADKRYVVYYNSKNGRFQAGIFTKPGDAPTQYTMGELESESALFFSLIPIALKDDEFKECYMKMAICLTGGIQPDFDLEKVAYILCDNLYRRIHMADQLGDAGIYVSIPSNGKIPLFTELNLQNGYYLPTEVLHGEFIVLTPKKQGMKTISKEGFEGKYRNEVTYSEKQQKMIPKLKDSYLIPEEVVSICEHISKTSGSIQPIRNIMLCGEAGTGKTSAVRAIACGLGRPLVSPITCHADTEASDFLLQCVPVSENEMSKWELPTLEDIQMDPSTAYHMLTGEYVENITETEVYNKLISCVAQMAREKADNKSPVRYQESSLITAMRYGFCCEIQEPSVILKQGVLNGLNSLLDDCQEIQLATGEIIHRHPNTIVIFTTNENYVGCQNMNQSVLSRMDLIYDIADLTKEEYIERGISNTGCQDRHMVEKMADTFIQIKNHLKEHCITDGSCGMREFISWIRSYMVTGNPLSSSVFTVLSSLSRDAENRQEVYDTCIKTNFL